MKSKMLPGRLCILFVSILIGITYTSITAKSKSISQVQQGISKKIVRFHVIANSDSEEDQALKLKVKDAVVSYISPLLKKSESIEQSQEILTEYSPQIEAIASQIIEDSGYHYSVSTTLCDTYFPTKSYGNYSFPPGEYRAYEIKIGEAKGKNWWCVLYPPLCFVDVSHGVVDEDGEKMLSDTLSTKEYNAVCQDSTVTYRFKYLKFLNHFIDR